MWTDRFGQYVLTAEPYEMSGTGLARLEEACKREGLKASYFGSAPWSPDALLVILRRAETAGDSAGEPGQVA